MKKAIILTALITLNFFYSFGQTNTNNKLVGTWRLIEFADRYSANGKWTYSYGEHPKRILHL